MLDCQHTDRNQYTTKGQTKNEMNIKAQQRDIQYSLLSQTNIHHTADKDRFHANTGMYMEENKKQNCTAKT